MDGKKRSESQGAKEVIVLGSPRSGTSMTAGLLAILGVDMGNVRPPDYENPTGYYEDIEFSQLIADLFKATDSEADGFNPPPQSLLAKQCANFRTRAQSLIAQRRETSRSEAWGWKVTSTILVMPLFLPNLTNPHFIVVVRNPLDIAKSMVEYTQRKAYEPLSLLQALKIANFYYERILSFLEDNPRLPWIVVSYENILITPDYVTKQLASFFELKISQEQLLEARQFVNPHIGRQRSISRLGTRIRELPHYASKGIRNPIKAVRFVADWLRTRTNSAK